MLHMVHHVCKKKLKPNDTIDKYKARLVAKGYTQKEGRYFFDIYLPIARMATIRVIFPSYIIWSSPSSNGREDDFS